MSEEAQTLSKYVEEIDQIAAQISLDRSTASVTFVLATVPPVLDAAFVAVFAAFAAFFVASFAAVDKS